jgi:hypothetical protein
MTSILAFVLGCLALSGLVVIGPQIDRGFCLPPAAERIGVEPTYGAIYNYIRNSVKPGMTRDKAMAVLEQIGPVISGTTHLPDGDIRDEISIKICSYWLNNIELFIRYTPDTQQVISVTIAND